MAVVLKHSTRCIVSFYALQEVSAFCSNANDVPCFLVIVQQQPDISDDLEDFTGLPHASPQVLLFQYGRLMANASHDAITAAWLAVQTGHPELF